MGMFDYVKCEASLPNGAEHPAENFQTRDLENRLHTYVITREGHLVKHEAPADGGVGDPDDGKGRVVPQTRALKFSSPDDEYIAFFQDGLLLRIVSTAETDLCKHSFELTLMHRKTIISGTRKIVRRFDRVWCEDCGLYLREDRTTEYDGPA